MDGKAWGGRAVTRGGLKQERYRAGRGHRDLPGQLLGARGRGCTSPSLLRNL